MTTSLNPDVRARLDAHLDAVERTLVATGHSREQRRGVVDDLEAQILDMLAAQSQTPTLADLDVVLARLDPPSAYGESAAAEKSAVPVPPPTPASPAASKPRYSRTAIWGLVCILASLLPLPLLFLAGWFLVGSGQFGPSGAESNFERMQFVATTHAAATTTPFGVVTRIPDGAITYSESTPVKRLFSLGCFMIPLIPVALLGTILGWIALSQIRSSNGALRGRGLALFDALFYPILMIVPMAVIFLILVLKSGFSVLLLILVSLLFFVLLLWLVSRRRRLA